MRFQAGLQIILLLTAGVIAFSVIKPKFASIQQEQSEVAAYRGAVQNIGEYNRRLQVLTGQVNSISPQDRSLLFRYLPEEVVTTEVARDIANIAAQNRMSLLEISSDEPAPVVVGVNEGFDDPFINDAGVFMEDPATAGSGMLTSHTFEVSVIGGYEDLKAMLRDLERNAYPLRLVKLEFSVEENSFDLVQYSLVLETYSLASS